MSQAAPGNPPGIPSHGGHHDHGHGGHHHHHAVADGSDAVFATATVLNLIYVGVEIFYGLVAHSMALLADAGHNFSDVLGLAAAWGAIVLSRRLPTQRYTYGLRGSSILAALLNAILLLIAVGGIAVEAVQRLMEPQSVAGLTVILVAACGVVLNGLTAWLVSRGSAGDLNRRSAFAHMLADALVSLGVVAAGAVILATGWVWLDPAVSLVISAIIVIGTWHLLRQSLNLALDAVPPGIDPAAVRQHLAALSGVAAVHDLHIWPMSTTETALTCHLVLPAGHPGDAALAEVAATLSQRFGIAHVTVQVETGDLDHPCQLVSGHTG